MLLDLVMAPWSTEAHNITLKDLALFRSKLRDSLSTNQMKDLVKKNAAEFSIRMMQLTRFLTKMLRQVVEDFSGVLVFKTWKL